MRRGGWLVLLSSALVAVAGWLLLSLPGQEAQLPPPVVEVVPPAQYELSRVVRYRYSVKNRSNRVMRDAVVWTSGPLALTSSQRIDAIETDFPRHSAVEGDSGQRLTLAIGTIPPHGARDVQVVVRFSLASAANAVDVADTGRYLAAGSFSRQDAMAIDELAAKLKGETPRRTARHVYDWVADNIRYQGYTRSSRGAAYALNKRQGDCTEFAALFVALMRANDIPARVIGGFVTGEDAMLRARDYHNWAEFYADGRWYLADPQRRVFVDGAAEYLAFRVIDAPELADGRIARFGVSPEQLRVTMY